MRVVLPEFIEAIILQWRPIDQGRLGAALANLEDDDWRVEQRVDWSFSPADKEELGLSDDDTVWAIAHGGVTVAFVESNDLIMVVYVNRRSAGNTGWL